jgi:predicted phage terminase large subunit-like protein
VAIESVAFQKVFAKMVEDECRARNLFFDVIKVVPHKDKVSRILGLQPRWESGNLLMKQGMSELEDELEKFPVGKHDDLLDALEMCNSICEPTTAGNGKVYIPRQYRRAW